MEKEKLKVLFIAGNGRSGSTILHNILGQLDHFFAAGELRYIWERGAIKNGLCGCGKPFHDCYVWQDIVESAFGGLNQIDTEKMSKLTESFRMKDLPRTLIPSLRYGEEERLSWYLGELENFYQAIQSTAGCKVIVDSSKNPSYGYLLQMIPSIDLYVLHFIRDSPAVAYSWSKKKEFQPGELMAQKISAKSALQWNARNLTAEMFLRKRPDRYLRLRYEDLIDNPQQSVRSIIHLLREYPVKLPFVTNHTVELSRVNHSVFGNSVRFQQGPVTLQLDARWRTKMSGRNKLTVSALTWPLRLRYGYLRPRSHHAKT